MKTSESIKTISPALLAAQRAIESASKASTNPFFKSKYADLPTVIASVKPALNDNNIVFLQVVGHNSEGATLTTRLLHESGEWIEDTAPIVCKDAADPQKVGSGLTYMRRYALSAMVGLPAEDDDGNAAAKPKKAKAPQDKPQDDSPAVTVTQVSELVDKWKEFSPLVDDVTPAETAKRLFVEWAQDITLVKKDLSDRRAWTAEMLEACNKTLEKA